MYSSRDIFSLYLVFLHFKENILVYYLSCYRVVVLKFSMHVSESHSKSMKSIVLLASDMPADSRRSDSAEVG